MVNEPRERLANELQSVEAAVTDDDLSADEQMTEVEVDAISEWADALLGDSVRYTYYDADGMEKTFATRSLCSYIRQLRLWSTRTGFDLTDVDAETFNEEVDKMHDGANPHVKEGGLSKSTLVQMQSAATTFYRYHDFGVDPEDIRVYNYSSPPRHDELDMFEEDEVESLKRHAGECGMELRDRALIELLIHTGQRISALRSLRLKDVDTQDGYLYLNTDYDEEQGGGLKGATERGRKRPMFGATKLVRDWIQHHPRRDEPEAPLFVGDPSHHMTDLSTPLNESTMRKNLKRIAEAAGVHKPVNPHNFRHYWVTVMKRDYGLDNDTIKMLMGSKPDSTVMETTYKHITDDEYIERAEVELGFKEDDGDVRPRWLPEYCHECDTELSPDDKRCPTCDYVYAPTGELGREAVKEMFMDDIVDYDDPEKREAVSMLFDFTEGGGGDDLVDAVADKVVERMEQNQS